MKTITRIIEEQVYRWQLMHKEKTVEKEGISIVTHFERTRQRRPYRRNPPG